MRLGDFARKTSMKACVIWILILVVHTLAVAQENVYIPDPNPAIQRRLEEWKDLKFGLLMHWGAYSQWGIVESWSICPEDVSWAVGGQKPGVADSYFAYKEKYEALPRTFNPTRFNPERWAAAAKEAGMKYMVFTTKHHDGFCMFDSRLTDYTITHTPFGSDPRANVTKEVFEAFRKQDFWIGAYFSKPDWHSDYYWWKKFPPSDRNCNYSIARHPEQWQKFVAFTHQQIGELVSEYGKLDILWLDGGWVRKKTDEEIKNELLDVYDGSRWFRNPQSQDIDMPGLVKMARAKQPNLIVVDRAVPGEYQNYLTPEQHIPDEGLPYPWETCMTMATSWSYVPGDQYKPANELIEKLVDIVSKGGNYLLNIGPGPDGEFDPAAYDRLRQIGVWMKINGESIYGTRMYFTFKDGENIRYTQSKDGKTRYIFLFDFPSADVILSKLKLSKGARITMLGGAGSLAWKDEGSQIRIRVPQKLKSAGDHVWVLKAAVK